VNKDTTPFETLENMAESDTQTLSVLADPDSRDAQLAPYGISDDPVTTTLTPPVDATLVLPALARARQEKTFGDERVGTSMREKLRATEETENHIPGKLLSEFCNLETTDESETQEEAIESERIVINRKRSEPLLRPRSFPKKSI
jgi:hypothetical protein